MVIVVQELVQLGDTSSFVDILSLESNYVQKWEGLRIGYLVNRAATIHAMKQIKMARVLVQT